jgi:U3 small nucleolar RNA-associated protein 14
VQQLGEMGLLDHESLAAEQEKAERARAEERMTLRHKNTSKWAKRLLQRNSLDPKVRASAAGLILVLVCVAAGRAC